MSMEGVREKMRSRMDRHITELSTALNCQPETITGAALPGTVEQRRELHNKLDHVLDTLGALMMRYGAKHV